MPFDLKALTVQEVAELLDVTVRSVYGWEQRESNPLPSFSLGGQKRFLWDQVRRWWLAFEIQKELGVRMSQTRTHGGGPEDGGVPNKQISEARKAHLDAETAAFKLAIMRKEYLHVTDYEQAHAARILRERAGLGAIKAKLTPRVGVQVATIVDEEIRKQLARMDLPPDQPGELEVGA